MPNLSFQVTGADSGARGLTPLLYFNLKITNAPPTERIHAVLLRTQIQFEAARRPYTDEEKDQLSEVFGTPERWGQTLRNKLWTHVDLSVPAFTGATEVRLPVPCTYDLNILAAKYFHALEGGDAPLLFLFSGTVFHSTEDGRLQIQQVSWEKECTYAMPVARWQELMERFFPQSAWVALHRDAFNRLYAYKRRQGLSSWEEAIDRLLAAEPLKEEMPV